MIDRRAFIGSLALGTLAVPRATPAQPTHKVYRIGILNSSHKTSDLVGPQTRSSTLNALLRALRELGYVYGQDFVTEPRGGESKPERFPGLAAELVRLQLDVVVAAGRTLRALKQTNSTIPVVMAASADPIGQGFVQSLAHPGGNFTGLSAQTVDLTAKRLELLKELVPRAAVVAVLWDRGTLPHWQAAAAAARDRGWKLLSLEIRDAGEMEGAFKAATDARAGALLVAAPGVLVRHARRITELAARSRLPATGGNITGMSFMLPELVGKQLEMLKEVLPKVSRVALLGNPANPGNAQQVRHAQDTARALGVRLQPLEARDPSGIDNAFAAITMERVDAVIVLVDSMLLHHRTRIADNAARRRLPTVSGMIEDTEAGSLLAYGPSILDRFRRAATYVDRILKGAKAADLPVEQPTTFELVINLKAAKALGLTIPQSLLQRADRVIQ